jgi:hypothetical protein
MGERNSFRLLGGMMVGLLCLVACGGGGSSSAGGSGGSGGSGGADAGAGGSGGAGGASAAYVCDNRSLESRCFDYWSEAMKSDVEASCDGSVIEGPCPLDKAVGTCAITAENPPNTGKVFTAVYYSDGVQPWTQATAQADCTAVKGVFMAL